MELDQERLRVILETEHSYYGSRPAVDRRDSRLNPQARDMIASQLHEEMCVVDIGCGSGETLMMGWVADQLARASGAEANSALRPIARWVPDFTESNGDHR